jgi:hypothetical protein
LQIRFTTKPTVLGDFFKDIIMTIFAKILTGAAGVAMVAGAAAPAAAQYAPNYGYNNGGNSTIGAVINSVLGGGRYGAYGQGNDRVAVDQCARAAEARVSHDQRNSGYGNYPQGNYQQGYNDPRYNNQGYNYGYNNNNMRTARVVGITGVERRQSGLKVTGVIDSGRAYQGGYGNQGYPNQGYGNQGYGNAYAYGQNAQVADLRFNCRVDFRGYVTSLDIKRNVAARRGY